MSKSRVFAYWFFHKSIRFFRINMENLLLNSPFGIIWKAQFINIVAINFLNSILKLSLLFAPFIGCCLEGLKISFKWIHFYFTGYTLHFTLYCLFACFLSYG